MASQSTGKLSLNREAAIKELSRGRKLTTQLQSLLRLSLPGGHSSELAGALSGEVMQALTAALSILKSSDSPIELNNIPVATSPCSDDHKTDPSGRRVASPAAELGRNRVDHGRRGGLHYLSQETSSPHYDGYQWRKYGQKKIRGTKFTRCTYRDMQGCLAMKRVQQQDNGDPPKFEVTYINQHTCSTEITVPQLLVDSPPIQGRLLYFDSNDHGFEQHQPHLSSLTTRMEEYNDVELCRTHVCSSPKQQGSQDLGSVDMKEAAPMTSIEDLVSDPYPLWNFQALDNDYMMVDLLDFEEVKDVNLF